jgi:hypothetical protein
VAGDRPGRRVTFTLALEELQVLQGLAEQNFRAFPQELRLAVHEHLRRAGLIPGGLPPGTAQATRWAQGLLGQVRARG